LKRQGQPWDYKNQTVCVEAKKKTKEKIFSLLKGDNKQLYNIFIARF
jgi:hypothetical protein